MDSSRPGTIRLSETVQLLLLLEPIWRAIQIDSIISVFGTLVIVCIAAGVILLATRKKTVWARDVLAGFGILSWLAAVGAAFWQKKFGVVEGVLTINLIAVAMLFTDSSEKWFGGKGK